VKVSIPISTLIFAVTLLFVSAAHSRVFDFRKENFAAVVGASYASSKLGAQAFGPSSASNVTYNSKLTYDAGGEFGFAYSLRTIRLRFGFEIFRPPVLRAAIASNAAGVALYTVDSDAFAYMPKLGVELNLREAATSRFYAAVDAGSANLNIKNSYVMTTAGQTSLGVTDFNEEIKASASFVDGLFGWETLAFDNTAVSFELGYRKLFFSNLIHAKDSVGFQGAAPKDSQAKNKDGTTRSLDLTNIFARVLFRFWVF
jgi:hypothetical protein